MFPQSDGDTLETGEMVNPATGKWEGYEERWYDLDVLAVDAPKGEKGSNEEGKRKGWVLRTSDEESEKVRGMIARVGQFIQGVVKNGENVGAERWEFDVEETKWRAVAKIGGGLGVKFEDLLSRQEGFNEGDRFTESAHGEWECVEAFAW